MRQWTPPAELDVANLCNNLGMIYKESGNFDQAEDNYLKALEILERVVQEGKTPMLPVYTIISEPSTSHRDTMGRPARCITRHLKYIRK